MLNHHRSKKKKKNSGIYQNRYPTSKDQKEATTRCSWKSVSREDTFNTTGLLVRTVVLKAKDTGSNLKSIKKEANDRLWPSLALDDLRCPCNHSAAAAVRSQHPHTELARDWRSSLHADWEEELTTHVRILAELRRHERGGTGCGICWRAFDGWKWEHPGARGGLGDKVTKLKRRSVHSLCLHCIVHCKYTEENACICHHTHLLSPSALPMANLICSHVLKQDEEMAHLQATLITRNTNSEPQLSKTGIHSFHQETRITKYCRVTFWISF